MPFKKIGFDKQLKSFSFSIDTTNWKYNIEKNQITRIAAETESDALEQISPDEKYTISIDNFNLKLKDNLSGNIINITQDGNETINYGTWLEYYDSFDETNKEKPNYELIAFWSPDSKKIIIPKFDRSKTQYMKSLQWSQTNGLRPHTISTERAMPGDTDLTMVTAFIYDVETKKITNIDLPSTPSFLLNFIPDIFYWTDDLKKVYTITHKRGYSSRSLLEIDLYTGKTKTILNESSKTYVDILFEYFEPSSNSNEFVWMSEQDGWNHIYLYDLKTGLLKNQITKGEYVVREIQRVDYQNRKIYFMASGVDSYMDPYLKQLYSISFDGSNLKLLTPEKANHDIFFINNPEYFVDSYSTVQLPTTWVIRSIKDGRIIMELEKIDISELKSRGWNPPTPFKIKARDGITDIYGVIYFPSTLDSTKKYPIIDESYSGPYIIRTPKSFSQVLNSGNNPLSELGFIIINIDGLGTGFRSKTFHDFSYKNLGDIGCLDHIKAIKEMSKKQTYMDTTRVGIFGHSHGGYDATRALIIHPEFYKVAVSSAGCHDFRIDKEFYYELYMGLLDKNYQEQSNIFNANKINGKLLLLHGAIDNNVNIVATMKLADELIKLNKDFDMVVIPSSGHEDIFKNKFATRKRWDFFVKNLLNVNPPTNFKLN